jgi:hypothetical protein
MSRFEPNEEGIREAARKAVQAQEPKAREHLAAFRCPDHPEGRFTTELTPEGFRVKGCCVEGTRLAIQSLKDAGALGSE